MAKNEASAVKNYIGSTAKSAASSVSKSGEHVSGARSYVGTARKSVAQSRAIINETKRQQYQAGASGTGQGNTGLTGANNSADRIGLLSGLKSIINYANREDGSYEKTKNYILDAQEKLGQIHQAAAAEGLSNKDKRWYTDLETSYNGVLNYLTERANRENAFEFKQNRENLSKANDTLGKLMQRRNDLQAEMDAGAANTGVEAFLSGTTAKRQADPREKAVERLDKQIARQQSVIEELQGKIAAYQPNTNDEREELIAKLQDPDAYKDEVGHILDPNARAKEYKRLRDADREKLKRIDESLYNESQDYTAGDRFEDWLENVGQGIEGNLSNAAGTAIRALDESAKYRMEEGDGGFLGDRSAIPGLAESDRQRTEAAKEQNAQTVRPTNERAAAHWQRPEWDTMGRAADWLQQRSDQLAEEAMENRRMAYTGASKGAQIAMDIGQTMIEMGFDAAVGAATGTGMLPMFARVFGQEAQQVRLQGGDINQQLGSGLTRAAIEVATEKLFDGVAGIFGKGAADDMVEDLIRELTNSRNGQNMLRFLAGSAGEGAEEWLADFFGVFSDMVWKNKSWREAYDDNMSEALKDFLMGAAVGAIGGGAGVISDTVNQMTGGRADLNIGGYTEKNAQIQFNRELEAAGVDPVLYRQAAERELDPDRVSLTEKGELTKKEISQMSAWQRGNHMLQQRQAKAMEEFQKEAMDALKKRSTLSGTADLSNVTVKFDGVDMKMTGFVQENGKTMVQLELPSGKIFTAAPGKVQFYDKNADAQRLSPAEQQNLLTGRFLEELSKQEHPEVMAMMYNPGQDVGEFINQWSVAERVYGRLAQNATVDTVLQAKELGGLTQEQIRAAFEVGRSELEQAKARTAVPEGVDVKSLRPGAGKVSYNGATVDGVKYDAVSLDTLSEAQQAQIKVLETLASVTGVNIVFYQSQVNAQGYYEGANGLYKNGCIYIDVNAGLDQVLENGRTVGEVAIVRTAAHELTHFIQDFNPAQYEKVRSFIIDTLLEEKGLNSLEDLIAEKQLRDRSGKLTREEAIDEVIADGCEMMLRDTKAIQKLAAEQPGIANRIRRWLSQWVKKIQAAFEGVDAKHREAQILMNHAEELQRLWDEAFENAARIAGSEYGKSDNQVRYEETAQEGGQYSLREFEDGRRYVDVNIDQAQFDGLTDREKQRLALRVIKKKFKGKVIGLDNRVFVNGVTAGEYAYPIKFIQDSAALDAKMRASTELDNLMDAGFNFRTAPDGQDGHTHPDAVGDFQYFDTIFKVGGEYYQSVINIIPLSKGLRLKDITQIKNITQDIYSSYGQNPKSAFLRDASMGNIPQGETESKGNIQKSERDYILIPENDILYDRSTGKQYEAPEDVALSDTHSGLPTGASSANTIAHTEEESKNKTQRSDREYSGDPRWRKYNGVEEEAVQHFGVTDNFRTTGYLLRDGRRLDFSGAHWLEGYDDDYIADWRRKNDIRQVDHEDVYEAFEQMSDNPPSDSARVFIERGNIRVSPEAPGIELSAKTEPSAEQYSQIRELVRAINEGELHTGRSFYVDLMVDGRSRSERLSYEGGQVNADRIIQDIKYYFQTGEIRQQSEVARFRYSVREEFAKEFDAWDGKKEQTFTLGTTSAALQSIGVDDRNIIWHSAKINEILKKHKDIRSFIKQVPGILENPVMVLKSKDYATRLVIIGEVLDKNRKPLVAILELEPHTSGGNILNLNVVASAYLKTDSPAEFVRQSELVYVDPDRERTKRFMQGLGLQLPSDTIPFGSIGRVTYTGKKVNIQAVPYKTHMKTERADTVYNAYGTEQGKTPMQLAMEEAQKKAQKSERDYGPDERDLVREYAARPDVHDEFLQQWLKKVQQSEALRMRLQDYDRSIGNLEERIRRAEAGELPMADPKKDREMLQKIRDSRDKVTERLNRLEKSILGMERRQEYKSAVERTRREWSGDPKETAKLIRELREMNRQLEEQVDYWKREGRITDPKERKARHSDVERYARELSKQIGYKGNIADLIGMMQDAADLVLSEDLNWSDLQERTNAIARELTMNAVVEFDPEADLRENLRERLRDLRIRPDESWTGDFGDWQDFRNRNFNRIFFSKEGESIDDVYQQLNGEFGDGLFPPDNTAGSDQVYQILAALDKLQPVQYSAFRDSEELAMMTATMQNEITNTLLYGNIGEELTQADRDYRSLGERLQKLQEEARQSRKTIAEMQRAQHLEIQGALMAQRQQYRDREKKQKARARIQKTGLRLLKYLTENNGQKNPIPEPMKEAVGSLLMDLDLSGGLDQKRKNRYVRDMQAVQKIVMQQQAYMSGQSDAWSGMMLDLPTDTIEQLNEHLERIQNAQERAEEAGRVWNPYMMNAEELEQLDDILTVFTNAITKANEILSDARGGKISDAAARGVQYLNSLKPDRKKRTEKQEALNKFLRWQNTTPYYFFRKFGEPGIQMFEHIQDGWDKFAFNAQQIIEYAESVYTAEEARAIQDVVVTFKLRQRSDLSPGMEKNEEVTMTKAQVMSLYCLWKREQARGHIAGAGIRIADYKQGRGTVSQTENYLLDLTDVAQIIDTMTEREKEIADQLQKYMNTVGSEWGNEVSMKRFGIRSFTEENYFPITTDDRTRQVRNPESDTANLYRLLNMSFTKSTVRDASNAIVLDNIFDVFSNHMADMAKYNGLGLPMLDAMKWFSYTVLDEKDPESGQYGYESMQKAAERAYGKEARNYFVTFLKDLNGVREGGRGEEFGSKILSNYKVAAVGANLRVAVLQPTSYVRAAAVLDRKYLAQGIRMSNKQGREEAEKYSGTAVWKSLGFYDTNINAGLREMIKHTDGLREQIQEVSMKGAEMGDKITWGALWNACKAEQQAQGVSDSELMERTARRFREVVYRTQVMDSTMTRSHVMRQKGVYAGMVTAFMSEPTVSFNMLLDAYGDYETKLRQGQNRSAAWQAAKGPITKAFGAYVATAALSAIVESMIDAMRDDDEYATYVERWLEKLLGVNVRQKSLSFGDAVKGFFGGNLMDDLLVHNKLPIIKDFFATLTGGSATGRMDTEWMNNVVKALNIWKESIWLAAGWQEEPTKVTYSGNMTTWGKLYATLRAASQLSGLPVGNGMRDAVALWNSSVGEFAPGMKIQTYDPGEEKSIMYAVKDGYLTEDEAVRWMMHYELAKDETEARQKVFVWENSGKYNRLQEAVKAGDLDEVLAAQEELMDLRFSPSSIQAAVKSAIQESYVEGVAGVRISKEEAARRLLEYGILKRDTDAEKQVEQWTSEVVTGIKYDDIDEAYVTGDIDRKRAEEMLQTYGSMTPEEAAAKVQQWSSEVETGIRYSEIGDAFLYGEITEQEAAQMYEKYGGKSPEDAALAARKVAFERDFGYSMERINIQADYADGGYTHDQMKQILMDYGYSKSEDSAESTVTRWDFVGQDWSLDSISGYEAQRYYNYNVDAAGISKEEWMDWLQIAKEADDAGQLSGDVKGISKKGAKIYVPYSKVDKILALIDTFPISDQEKEALFLAGWDSGSEGNEKNLWRAPWRKRR